MALDGAMLSLVRREMADALVAAGGQDHQPARDTLLLSLGWATEAQAAAVQRRGGAPGPI
jgi:hypothetical protein